MKRILLFSCLVVFAAACASQPPGNKDVTSNANANKPAETKSTGAVSEADIIAKEKASWDVIKKKDWDGFAKTLASDYIEVLDDGVHDKAKSVESVKDFDLSDVTYSDWKMLPIDKDAVIITYSVTVKANFKGQPAPPGPYREASVYVNRNGEWITVFYQETLSRKPMAQPSPPKESAKSKSPMAKPADAGSDVTANEKMVWDALKSGNYDAFASYLASDSMEIEADGVYDKSGSVKNVSGMNMSKTDLSGWRTLKFDDDASVVTYVVKMPAMPGMNAGTEYHSTIWVRRDGKWQALFHQGTPAAPAEEKK